MAKQKSRKDKLDVYQQKYADIPVDYYERISWLYDKLNINDKKADDILQTRTDMFNFLYYRTYKIILFEDPEGTPRHRYRLINRNNLINEAMNNGSFVHVYSPHAKEDSLYMKRLVKDELCELNDIIYTPCDVEYNTFHKIPSYFNAKETMLSEIGMIRPVIKPDWDNMGKKYSDMYNGNVWVDDVCVIRGTVDKYYSVLPRIEINLKYLNAMYTKHQAKSMQKRVLQDVIYFK